MGETEIYGSLNGSNVPLDTTNFNNNLGATEDDVQKAMDKLDDLSISGMTNINGYNASTNTPDLDTSPSGILKGDRFFITTGGTFFTQAVQVEDMLIAKIDNPTVLGDWIIVEGEGAVTEDSIVTSGNGTIASGGTTDIGAEKEKRLTVTGTTGITGFGTVAIGTERTLIFADALILTHNATSLILPSGANITTAANDTLDIISLGSGNWRVTNYEKADGKSLIETASPTVFADNVFRVQDDGDATKEIAFQASGITTGTVRTITMPDANVDLGDVGIVDKIHNISTDAGMTTAVDDVIANPRKSKNIFKVSADLQLEFAEISSGTVEADIHYIADQTTLATRPKITDKSYQINIGTAKIRWDGIDYESEFGDSNNFFNGVAGGSSTYEFSNSDFFADNNRTFIKGKDDNYTNVKMTNCTGTITGATAGFFATDNNGAGAQKEIMDVTLIGCDFKGIIASASDTVEELNITLISSNIINNGNGVWNATGGGIINVFYTPDSNVDQTLVGGSSAVTFTKIFDNPLRSWQTVDTGRYTATPASTSTLTMSDTTGIFVGMAVRYKDSGGPFSAIATAVTSSLLTIAGAPFDTGDALTLLQIGHNAVVVTYPVGGTYGNGTDDNLLANDTKFPEEWALGKAKLVTYKITHDGVDTGTEPKINIELNNLAVSTNDTNKGIQPTTSGAWVENPAVAISTANYVIERGEEVEIACKEAGGTGDASDLNVSCTFILEGEDVI